MNKTEILVKLASRAPIFNSFNMSVEYNSSNGAVFKWPYDDGLSNGKDVHGGVLATLIDCAAWFTAAVEYDSFMSTVEFSTRILEPANKSNLSAVGTIIRAGKRLCSVTVDVRSEDQRLIAIGLATLTSTSMHLPGISK